MIFMWIASTNKIHICIPNNRKFITQKKPVILTQLPEPYTITIILIYVLL